MQTENRRDFLKQMAAGGALLAGPTLSATPVSDTNARGAPSSAARTPNIVLYLSDEFRADFIGASGENFYVKTPNLDKLARRGAIFTHAVTNQPLCSPARACMLTGRYATETNVWKLEVDMRRDLPTLATVLRDHGYTANMIGKWHLAKTGTAASLGWVAPESRGGFLDVWEGANV